MRASPFSKVEHATDIRVRRSNVDGGGFGVAGRGSPLADTPVVTRRRFLGLSLAAAGAIGMTFLLGDRYQSNPVWAQSSSSRLDEFARNAISGGPPKDGIPPIENPQYATVAEADKFLQPDDVVFGLDYKGVVKAFPQNILVWHEIINEEIAGEKISVTYCPLTGSTVSYKGRSKADGKPLTFGTSGKLVNSNLLMYDRQSDSTWPQVLGVGITGPNKGHRLDTVPTVWTTWSRWKLKYPNSLVLSRKTGHLRAYGRDPYGSYTADRPNYYNSGGPFFPVMTRSSRFPNKKVVVGVKAADDVLALPKAEAAAAGVVNFNLDDQPVVALYDAELDESLAFIGQIDGRELQFVRRGSEILDEQTRTVWTAQGKAVKGKFAGAQLSWTTSFDVMWFAWYAFYPETKVLVP